jgi:hypothetical protein
MWIHHGKITVVDDYDVDEADDAETLQYLSRFLGELRAQMDCDFGNEQGGDDAGGCHRNGDDGGVDNDGRARQGDAEDFDNLEDMVRALGPEILKSKKGLENLERVTKASTETVYGVEKGCPSHWTLLRFVLELLFLKAKYGWSDCSFNDLLRLLSWLVPQPNSVPTNTYQAKKVISPLTMGVEKIYACPNIVSFFVVTHSKI